MRSPVGLAGQVLVETHLTAEDRACRERRGVDPQGLIDCLGTELLDHPRQHFAQGVPTSAAERTALDEQVHGLMDERHGLQLPRSRGRPVLVSQTGRHQPRQEASRGERRPVLREDGQGLAVSVPLARLSRQWHLAAHRPGHPHLLSHEGARHIAVPGVRARRSSRPPPMPTRSP